MSAGGEGLEVERGERAHAGAPVRAALEELGPGEGDDRDRDPPAPLEDVVDEVEQPRVRVLEVLEQQDHGGRVGQPLEERPPGGEQLVGGDLGLDAEQGEQGGLDPGGLVRVADVGADGRGDPLARRRLVVALGETGSAADHLAEGPERDPVAVGGRAPLVPPDVLGQAVEVLRELPGEAGLADPGLADHRHEAGPALPPGGREQVLEQAELLVAADERRLEGLAPVAPAAPGDDADGAPGGDRGRLARQRLVARGLEGDRARCGPPCRLAHEHRPGRRGRLEAGGGVDDVARHHPLVDRPDRDRGLAGQDPGPGHGTGAQRSGPRRRARGRRGRPARRRPRGPRARPRRPSPRRR